MFRLILAFDSDDPEFTRGFELGRLWESVERGADIDQLIHAENTEMVIRLAESRALRFHAEEVSEGWFHVKLWKG